MQLLSVSRSPDAALRTRLSKWSEEEGSQFPPVSGRRWGRPWKALPAHAPDKEDKVLAPNERRAGARYVWWGDVGFWQNDSDAAARQVQKFCVGSDVILGSFNLPERIHLIPSTYPKSKGSTYQYKMATDLQWTKKTFELNTVRTPNGFLGSAKPTDNSPRATKSPLSASEPGNPSPTKLGKPSAPP